jgi:hypothetical protein
LENCKITAIYLQRICIIYGDIFCRYSNTLLVSLNNRISIREAAATKEVSIKTPVVTFAVTPPSEDSTDGIAMEPSAAHEAMSLGDNEGHERLAVRQ